MEEFADDYYSILLSKEWLVKVDNANSIPYLFKFAVSEEKSTCFILVTDMKTVWTEVLTKNQLFRRWRHCNPSLPLVNNNESFSQLQSLIRDLHSPGGVSDTNFDVVESRDADLAFELDCDNFKWRWDTFLLSPKTSADVLSKHLILPLISLAHVSFYSADPVSELEEGDLEKTVDKIGRTARRSVDIHVKQTLARPRIATSLQRISSLLGLASSLRESASPKGRKSSSSTEVTNTLPSAPIRSEAEPPDLEGHLAVLRAHIISSEDASSPAVTDNKLRGDIVQSSQTDLIADPVRPSAEAKTAQPAPDAESATESDSNDDQDIPASKSREPAPQVSSRTTVASAADRISISPVPQNSDSGPPPTKKIKSKRSDSESDSDSGAKGRSQSSQGASAGARSVIGRGVRQPLKRGGRRF